MDKLLFRRILVAVLTLLALIYAVYLLLMSTDVDMYTTENAVETSVTDKISADAFIIRDENCITDNSGVLSYSVSDGEQVGVNGEIAKIYSNESDASAQAKADTLEEQVASLEELQKTISSNSIGIDTINTNISNSIISALTSINNGDILEIGSMFNSLNSAVNQRQIYTEKVDSFDEQIAALNSQIQQLRNSSGSSIGTIKAEKAGYFSSQCDGYESAFSYDNIGELKLDDLENISKSEVSSNTVGKIISSPDWYIVCEVSADEAVDLSLWSDTVTVLMSNVCSETIPAQIDSIKQESKSSDALLILKCSYMNSDLIEARQEPIEIGLGTYSGLRVSKRAVHDDYLTKTTYDEDGNKTNEEQKVQGVYTLYGNEVQFKQISIIYSGKDYVICDEDPDDDILVNGETVDLYDQVIVEGDDLYDGKVIK